MRNPHPPPPTRHRQKDLRLLRAKLHLLCRRQHQIPIPQLDEASVAKIRPPTRKSTAPMCDPSSAPSKLNAILRKSLAVTPHLQRHNLGPLYPSSAFVPGVVPVSPGDEGFNCPTAFSATSDVTFVSPFPAVPGLSPLGPEGCAFSPPSPTPFISSAIPTPPTPYDAVHSKRGSASSTPPRTSLTSLRLAFTPAPHRYPVRSSHRHPARNRRWQVSHSNSSRSPYG